MTNQEKIYHLYARAGFGLAPEELNQLNWNVEKAVQELFDVAQVYTALKKPDFELPGREAVKVMTKEERKQLKKKAKGLTKEVNLEWVECMINAPVLREKMSLFWHSHFACTSKEFDRAIHQVNTIRKLALGNFKDLVLAIARDPSMIFYLNNQQNRKSSPNENFARELMELFTIGRGNYTERDIKEAARAFTGWFVNKDTRVFEFKPRQHDFGNKTFMGKTGRFNGEDIIDILFEKRETAHFISRKVYRYFVNDRVNETHVRELGDKFYSSKYDISAMLKHLFTAPWFYDDKNQGTKIKSPIELFVGLSKVLKLDVQNKSAVFFVQRALGQVLFNPPNVAGWPGGQAWIDNSTLLLRCNLVSLIFDRTQIDFKTKEAFEAQQRNPRVKKLKLTADLTPITKAFVASQDLKKDLSTYLLRCKANLNNSFIDQFLAKATSKEEKIKAWLLGLMTMPEYQMC